MFPEPSAEQFIREFFGARTAALNEILHVHMVYWQRFHDKGCLRDSESNFSLDRKLSSLPNANGSIQRDRVNFLLALFERRCQLLFLRWHWITTNQKKGWQAISTCQPRLTVNSHHKPNVLPKAAPGSVVQVCAACPIVVCPPRGVSPMLATVFCAALTGSLCHDAKA